MRDEYVQHRMAREAKILKDDPIVKQMELVPIHMGDDVVLVPNPHNVQKQLERAAAIKQERAPKVRKRFLAALIGACVFGAAFAHSARADTIDVTNVYMDGYQRLVYSCYTTYPPPQIVQECYGDDIIFTNANTPVPGEGTRVSYGVMSPNFEYFPSYGDCNMLDSYVGDLGELRLTMDCRKDTIFANNFQWNDYVRL